MFSQKKLEIIFIKTLFDYKLSMSKYLLTKKQSVDVRSRPEKIVTNGQTDDEWMDGQTDVSVKIPIPIHH